MYAIDFEFRNERLSDYGMMICSFDGSSTEAVSSGCDLTFNTIKPSGSNNFRLYSSTYEEAYTCEFSICRNMCANYSDDFYLTLNDVLRLQRWLCQKNEYNEFKIDQDGYRGIYWNVVFTIKQYMINGKIAGLNLVLTADAPYGYGDRIDLDFDVTKNEGFDIYDQSDEIGYIYPQLTIKLLEDGDFILNNSLDIVNRNTYISNCKVGEIITIDGKNQIITSSDSSHINLSNDFNYRFPKIINTYDDNLNTYISSLNCEINVKYSPIKKVGL